MHFLYIIFSQKIKKYYVGETQNVENRLEQHNLHYFNKGFTNAASDWKLKLAYKCNSKCDAIYLEKYIKRMKSKIFIEKVINNSNILKNLIAKK